MRLGVMWPPGERAGRHAPRRAPQRVKVQVRRVRHLQRWPGTAVLRRQTKHSCHVYLSWCQNILRQVLLRVGQA